MDAIELAETILRDAIRDNPVRCTQKTYNVRTGRFKAVVRALEETGIVTVKHKIGYTEITATRKAHEYN